MVSGFGARDVRLRELNRRFYRDHAATFAATRGRPWPGWRRVLETVGGDRPESTLDLGCGNGRLLDLIAAGSRPARYVGVDQCLDLLGHARRRLTARSDVDGALVAWDLLRDELPLPVAAGHQLVALFGVAHHVPTVDGLRRLLAAAHASLRPGGCLAVSFWQFAERERFQRRILPWADFNRRCPAAGRIQVSELERGDHLLAWGRAQSRSLRYCHHSDDREATELVDSTELEVVDTYRADGDSRRLNLYFLLARPHS